MPPRPKHCCNLAPFAGSRAIITARSGRWPVLLRPSMQVYVVENVTHGNFAYSNLNEGYGKVLRYGAYSPEVLAKLRWMNDVMGPLLAKALERSGDGIDIRALLAESLHMGDEGHNRNKAGSLLYTTKLAPWIVRVGPRCADGS